MKLMFLFVLQVTETFYKLEKIEEIYGRKIGVCHGIGGRLKN